MKYLSRALVLALILAGAAYGFDGGVVSIDGNITFPLSTVDTLGRWVTPDSFQVLINHEDAADNSMDYSASGTRLVAWIMVNQPFAAADSLYSFRDAIADIDAGQGNGMYSGVVFAYAQGERFPTYFNFYLADTSMSGMVSQTEAILADVTGINGADGSAWVTSDGDTNQAQVAVAGDAMTLAAGAVDAAAIADDAIDASTYADDAAYMVYGGGVWVDTTNGTSGIAVGVNGLPSNPVKGIQDGKVIADLIGAEQFFLIGDPAGATYVLQATMEGYEFIGDGDHLYATLDLNGQDVDHSEFIHLTIIGTQGGTERIEMVDCAIEGAAIYALAHDCSLRGSVTLQGKRDNIFDECYSAVPGADKTPSLIFSGGSETVMFRHYSGGLHLFGMGSNDSLSFDATGQLQIGAGVNVNATIAARGMTEVVDSTAGLNNLNYTATAQYAVDSTMNAITDANKANFKATGYSTFDNTSDSVIVNVESGHAPDGLYAAIADSGAAGSVTASDMQSIADSVWGEVRHLQTDEDTYGAGLDTLIANVEGLNDFDPATDSVIINVESGHAADGLYAAIADSGAAGADSVAVYGALAQFDADTGLARGSDVEALLGMARIDGNADIFYVSKDGSGGDGTTWATAENTIQAGLDNCTMGTPCWVFVGPGTYTEAVNINNHDTHLIGAGRDWTVINPTSGDAIDVDSLTIGEAKRCEIAYLTVIAADSGVGSDGIHLGKAPYTHLHHVNVIGAYRAINLGMLSDNCHIHDNFVWYARFDGIKFGSDYNWVHDNVILMDTLVISTADGIAADGEHNIIQRNIVVVTGEGAAFGKPVDIGNNVYAGNYAATDTGASYENRDGDWYIGNHKESDFDSTNTVQEDIAADGDTNQAQVAVAGDAMTLSADAINAAAYADNAAYVVYGGGVWVDAGANTNTVVGVDGIPTNPVGTIAAAKTIADAIGTKTIYFVEGTNETFVATMEHYHFIGVGNRSDVTLNLGGQDVDHSMFENVVVTGIQGGTNLICLERAILNGTDSLKVYAHGTGFFGDISVRSGSDSYFDQCYSAKAGSDVFTLTFGSGAATENVNVRHFSGGLRVRGMSANDVMSFESDGQFLIGDDCDVNATVVLRGMMTFYDSTAGVNLTHIATAQSIADTLQAIMDSIQFVMDSLATQVWATSGGGSSLWTQAGVDSQQVHRELLLDSLGSQGWAAIGGAGAGAKTVNIYAVDTSGTDTRVPWQRITVSTLAGVVIGGGQLTDSDGKTSWGLDASTSYLVTATGTGYIWATDDTITTDAGGGSYDDSTLGYDIAIGLPDNPALKRIYVDFRSHFDDTLEAQGANLCLTLIIPTGDNAPDTIAVDSATGIIIEGWGRKCVNAVGPPAGRAIIDVYPTSGLWPPGCRYKIEALRPSGKAIWDITIPLTGTGTEEIGALHRTQEEN